MNTMKRLTAFIIAFAIILLTLCSCAKKQEEEKLDIGEELTVTQIQNGDKKEQAHMTDKGYVEKMDHYNSKGTLVYIEEHVYDLNGEVSDFIYRDTNDNFLARYNPSASKFYNEDDEEISENDFLKMLDEIGAND